MNEVISALHEGLRDALGSHLVALYLTGSLAYGDFDIGSSDIDFFVVLGERMSTQERQVIESLHLSIEQRLPQWAGRIETTYVPRHLLSAVDPPTEPRPYFNYGRMWDPDPTYGYEWLMQLASVRDFGIPIAGPAAASLIPPIDAERLIEASAQDIWKEWEPALDDLSQLGTPHVRAYGVHTMCRALYRRHTGHFAAKRRAAAWAKDTYEQWRDLVMRADEWSHGEEFSSADEVAAFIRFTLRELTPSNES